MRILVTGATGFIGQHLIPQLLQNGHEIIATSRTKKSAVIMPWYKRVSFIQHDLQSQPNTFVDACEQIDAVIHLAWQGLPNYQSCFHFEDNLPTSYQFIKALVESGISKVLVTGTCFEYGMQNGCLSENMPTHPENPYGLAKDTLRKFLQALQKEIDFSLLWVRLFYMYGAGQNSNSLLAQLDQAIENKTPVFNMSGGEQLRDYLPVEKVASNIVTLIEHPKTDGIYNCCSGQAISVRRLAEERIKERNASIQLNLGYYPYPDYEAMAFWGSNHRIRRIIENE